MMKHKHKRNNSLVDKWSFVHIASSAALTVLFGPLWAFILAALWEPFEIFLLSPLLAKRGVVFGYEDLANSLSDIAFNSLGILLAYLVL